MKALAAKALGLARAMGLAKGLRGTDAGAASQTVDALRGIYRTPWELALQHWLESVAPGDRTFARASRRGAGRADIVLPGRKREGWILNIVLDTSGSMTARSRTRSGRSPSSATRSRSTRYGSYNATPP